MICLSCAEHLPSSIAFPSRDADAIRKQLRMTPSTWVSAIKCSELMSFLPQKSDHGEPEAVNARRRRGFKQRFYGVGEIWARERHVKWGPCFGLWLRFKFGGLINIRD